MTYIPLISSGKLVKHERAKVIDPPPKKERWLTEQETIIAEAVGTILRALGQEFREGLADTPGRVARFYTDFLRPEPFNLTVFDGEGYDQLILQKGIPFTSLCEHHMLPFFGVAHVAYLPGTKIVGLSKLARLVQHYSRRLQNQERITQQVAYHLQDALEPIGVGVVLEAEHMCMSMRGVKATGARTTTSCLLGVFQDGPVREEFFSLIK